MTNGGVQNNSEKDEHSLQKNARFDVAHTMDRLKHSFVGRTPSRGYGQSAAMSPNSERSYDDRMGVHYTGSLNDENDYGIYGTEMDDDDNEIGMHYQHYLRQKDDPRRRKKSSGNSSCYQTIINTLHQVPAVALIAMFHLMIGVPFGVSYFPIGWREAAVGDVDGTLNPDTEIEDGVDGDFPIPGKDALGIRMFLFSTIIGQMVFTFTSGFGNPISLQMVENVPFCQSLAHIVISHEGYGMRSLSTLMFMFGLSSVVVGVVFYFLGRMSLGRIIYFFPTHVLVGCIAGIGLFIVKTGVEVTIDKSFTGSNLIESLDLFGVVLAFEVFLRLLEKLNLDKDGKQKFSLLSPIYFCMITPTFYLSLRLLGLSVDDAMNMGYFFPSLVGSTANVSVDATSDWLDILKTKVFTDDLMDIWRIIDFTNISWSAVFDSIPTLIALSLFSLIHVPINIPAFSISTNQEVDMNIELMSHGYSNIIAGICGGLQNYMAYTQSVLYARSGGWGKPSGVAVALVTSALFLFGPTIASYIPRCMAGTLLLHVGIDLFLEGVYDTYGKFEKLEYMGTLLIAIVMTVYGMNAAMIAGGISAVSTYAVQTVAYLHPIRGQMTGVTLRSSKRNRHHKANAILEESDIGRSRILVIQLQGHLFFGNMAQLNESIGECMSSKYGTDNQPWIVILDFSLVLGIDSSAAQALIKIKKLLKKRFDVRLSIFVTGSTDGFPCDYNLSAELMGPKERVDIDIETKLTQAASLSDFSNEETALLAQGPISECEKYNYEGCQVCQSLDLALVVAENALIFKQDPSLLGELIDISRHDYLSEDQEKELGLKYLKIICPEHVEDEDIEILFSLFQRQTYRKDELLWAQASPGDCAMLLLKGSLLASLENEAGTNETVQEGRMVGELGLVQGSARMSSLRCVSQEAIAYRLSIEDFEDLIQSNPSVARLMDQICISYLADRVQHVSNRIFETRCLPI